ncbi:MAG: GGDEF domain-containing protein [Eubacteriales bacterium]|nr:GGDEF domain-containing protein [Eubacteriales bacterium]
MIRIFENTKKKIIEATASDTKRSSLLFVIINTLIGIVALVMTLVNVFTVRGVLMGATAAFAGLCFLNVFVFLKTKVSKAFLYAAFCLESLILIGFFIISGNPAGFSVQWICLIPAFAFLAFKRKNAVIFCSVALVMLLFLFWCPFGKSFLQYDYSETFMLRFPLFYMSVFGIAFLTELIRFETQKQLEDSKNDYFYLYRHDSLTGLLNRFGIKEYFDDMNEKKDTDRFALLMMDIDNFKNVNDTYGHNFGDEVLKKVSSIPLGIMCEHSNFCRWGGEEFLLVMQCDHDPMETAEKIRAATEKTPVYFEGTDLYVTVSIGVAVSTPENAYSINELIERADRAMYESKGRGKNCVTLYSE